MKRYLSKRIIYPLSLICLSGIALADNKQAEASTTKTDTQRIVGGKDADPGEYPFAVSLQDSLGHFCGASIISPTFVMSAAHCSGGSMDAVFGVHDQDNLGKTQKISVKKQINHPKYNGSGYDIAVYELSEPIDPEFYAPINLASGSDVSAGTMTTVVGWGLLKESGSQLATILQEVDVPIVSHSVCDEAYGVEGESIDENTEICAGYSTGDKDSCQGDSGGPLVIKKNNEFYQVGVVSWGIGCAQPNLYGVYSHVPNLKSWVASEVPNLGGDTDRTCYENNVTLKLKMDNYGNETSWEIKNKSGKKVASGGHYNNNEDVSKAVNLSDGDYTFTINDTYGDGMSEGNGNYQLTESNGKVIQSGGDFRKSESASFCTRGDGTGGFDEPGGFDDTDFDDTDDTGANCFKSQLKFVLKIDDNGYETDWEIADSSGIKMFSGGNYPPKKRIKETMTLPNGNYKFSIFDSQGDGLSAGKGKFFLKDANNDKIVKGRKFGDEVTEEFCISD